MAKEAKRRKRQYAEFDRLYRHIPNSNCKGLCGRDEDDPRMLSCISAVTLNQVERERIVERVGAAALKPRADNPHVCPLLKGGRCSVYDIRPLNCRLWASVDLPGFRCPFGCRPAAGELDRAAAHELTKRGFRISDRMVMLTDPAKVTVMNPATGSPATIAWTEDPDLFLIRYLRLLDVITLWTGGSLTEDQAGDALAGAFATDGNGCDVWDGGPREEAFDRFWSFTLEEAGELRKRLDRALTAASTELRLRVLQAVENAGRLDLTNDQSAQGESGNLMATNFKDKPRDYAD
jgi:hypothetical protein